MPLGARYDAYIKPEDRFSPLQAKMLADEAVAGRSITAGAGSYPMHVSMVVDLTRSSRYYDARQWGEMGMVYCKVLRNKHKTHKLCLRGCCMPPGRAMHVRHAACPQEGSPGP